MYLELRINTFAHCWDKRSLITVCAKTWQDGSTRVSKIVRSLVSWGDKITKTTRHLKLIERVKDIVIHDYAVGF